jgi:transposase
LYRVGDVVVGESYNDFLKRWIKRSFSIWAGIETSGDEKLVFEADTGQRPAAALARELGVPRNRLYKWHKEVAAHGGAFPGSGRHADSAAELARLKRELARVTEERDILKKAATYFARESL